MPGAEVQESAVEESRDAADQLPTFDLVINNNKAIAVELYRVKRDTFEEEFVQILEAGASLERRVSEADSWVAKIDGLCVARYTACTQLPRWRLRAEKPGALAECSYVIENRRTQAVDVYRVSQDGKDPIKVLTLGPGATAIQDSFDRARWVAQVGDVRVGAYQVTTRVPCWTLSDGESDFVPELPIGNNSDLNEAAETVEAYQRATGSVRAIMVFVRFPDVDSDKATAQVAADVVGNAPNWYHKESYGRLSFSVTPCHGWRMMPDSAATYNQIATDWSAHLDYIATALQLISTDEVNFAEYNIVYVVAAETPKNVLANSPTLSAGIEVPTNNAAVRHVVTFGRDCYSRSYNVLLHETGHLMGLPDLYSFEKPYPDLIRPAGAWDIMCHLDGGRHYLGWHKYKLGWLDESQLLYVKSGEVAAKLHGFDDPYGIKMIVLPGERDSKIYVIEAAQPLGSDGEWRDKGILVYTVDAAVPTGRDPVRVISGPEQPSDPDESERYGALYYAYLPPGTTQTFELNNGEKIEVANERREGPDFLVRAKRLSALSIPTRNSLV